jgi:murein tripeptide amidase MpaA
MMEGFLNELIRANNPQTLWIVIPMLNVDGVVLGNNRTGIVGYDLNRLYSQ